MIPCLRLKILRRCFILTIIFAVSSLSFITFSKNPMLMRHLSSAFGDADNSIFQVYWHLDLKGAPPLPEVIENYLRLTARSGATGILMEFEDTFPFEGSLKNISATNAYSKEQLKKIWTLAEELDLKVIPLVQSFGHMEYMLKLKDYAHLREISTSPSDACPSNHETKKLILEAVRQILDIFPSQAIHIGGDEVISLGQCSECKRTNLNPLQIYVKYMYQLAFEIKSRWGVNILMWDDMIRQASLSDLKELKEVVEPVVWAYSETVTDIIPKPVLSKYSRIFQKHWVASNFKGASYPDAILPNIYQTATNTFTWIKLLSTASRFNKSLKNRQPASGIIITGWSRFDHFSRLCELLPPSVPSLIYALLASRQNSTARTVMQNFKSVLNCPNELKFDILLDPFLKISSKCKFFGSDAVKFMSDFMSLQKSIDFLTESPEVRGWLTKFHENYKFFSPTKMNLISKRSKILSRHLNILNKKYYSIFKNYFDNFTLAEWNEQNFTPLENVLKLYDQRSMYGWNDTQYPIWPKLH